MASAEEPQVPLMDGDVKRYVAVQNAQLAERIVFLFEGVNPDSARRVVQQLLYLSSLDSTKDITLYLDSPGGTVTDLWAIYDTMQQIPCDVRTICIGQAASAAAILLAAGAPGKRVMTENSRVLIHQPSAGASGQETMLRGHAIETTRMRKQLEVAFAAHTGQPVARVHRDMERDTILTATQAFRYGIIDVIQGPHKAIQGPNRPVFPLHGKAGGPQNNVHQMPEA